MATATTFDPADNAGGRLTFRQYQEEVVKWMMRTYACSREDAWCSMGPYQDVYIQHVRSQLLDQKWIPPAWWVADFKRLFPEYWLRRLMHDYPDLLDRLSAAGLQNLLIVK